MRFLLLYTFILLFLGLPLALLADTPPPLPVTAVNLKGSNGGALVTTTSGTGHTALDVNVIGGGSSTSGVTILGGVAVTSSVLPTGAATDASVIQVDTDLLSFKAANHTDLLNVQTNQTTANGLASSSLTQLQAGTSVTSTVLAPNASSASRQDSLLAQITGGVAVTSIPAITATVSGGIAVTSSVLPPNAATAPNQIALQNLIAGGISVTSPVTVAGGVAVTSTVTTPVTGTFFQSIQPVSASSLPLPTGASTASGQASLLSQIAGGVAVTSSIPISATVAGGVAVTSTVTTPVTGTFFQAVQPVSATSLPLPTNAATATGQASLLSQLTGGVAVTSSVPISVSSLPVVTIQGGVSATVLNFPSTQNVNITGASATVPVSVLNGGIGVTGITPGTAIQIVDSAGTNKLLVGSAGNITVSGLTAVGSPPALNPVTVAGVDGAGNKQYLPLITGTNAVKVDGSGTTQPVSGSFSFSGGVAVTSNVTPLNLGISGTITGTCSTPSTSCPAGSVVTLPLNGVGSARVIVGGAFTGATLNVDGTVDGNTWFTLFTNSGGVGTTYSSASFSTAGNYRIYRVASLADVRLRASALSTGSVTATFNASAPSDVTEVAQFSSANFAVGIFGNAGGTSQTQVSVDGSGNVNTNIVNNNAGLATSSLQGLMNTTLSTLMLNSTGLSISSEQVNGLAKTQIVDGGGNAVSATNNNLNVLLPDLVFTGASAQTAVVNNIITNPSGSTATAVSGYRSGSCQIVSTGTGGTFIFEGSNDNTNFQVITVYSQALITGVATNAAVTATASQLIYTFPVSTNFVRIRIATTITGGSIESFCRFSQATWTPAVFQVAQNTAGNLNTTISGSVTANAGSPSTVADIPSAAITTTTTSGAFTQGSGNCFTISIPVTVASGTGETMDVEIQESIDTGVNYVAIWDMPRISATGSYDTPTIYLRGNRIRYVQTIGGSSPSFTRAIGRMISQAACTATRQLIDRTINLASANSTTATLETEGIKSLRMEVNTTAISGTAVVTLQGSENFQTASPTWVNIGQLSVSATGSFSMDFPGVSPQAVRAITTSAAGSVTLGYVLIKGY